MSAVVFNLAVHLAWGHVAVGNVQNPLVLTFTLKRSKCDQFGNGVDVFIGRSGDELCPVTAVLTYITRRGNCLGAFFLLEGERPLAKAHFSSRVQAVLWSAGVQFNNYTITFR